MIENQIKFREPVCLERIIDYTCKNLEDFHKGLDSYCVYCKEYKLDYHLNYYLDDSPEINDDDEEIYSDFVLENHLEFVVSSEVISIVLEAVLSKKESASNEEILEAINYYREHDTLNL